MEQAGYKVTPKKCEFFKKEIEWVGHKIDQQGIRPLQDKLETFTKINIPKNEKKLKLFLGAIQYLSKYIENLSANTDVLRNLFKKKNEWIWTDEHTKAFNKLKEGINKIPCLAHYNARNENVITTDASTKRLGATLWQKQKDGNLKPVGFASRYLYRKEICRKRIRTTGSSVGIGTLSTIHIQETNRTINRPPSAGTTN